MGFETDRLELGSGLERAHRNVVEAIARRRQRPRGARWPGRCSPGLLFERLTGRRRCERSKLFITTRRDGLAPATDPAWMAVLGRLGSQAAGPRVRRSSHAGARAAMSGREETLPGDGAGPASVAARIHVPFHSDLCARRLDGVNGTA